MAWRKMTWSGTITFLIESPGARVGLVLIEALADRFDLEGEPGAGTTVRMAFVHSR
jgi:hypothetical protein